MSKQHTAGGYETMSLEELNAANDDFGRQIEALQDERRILNLIRKRKAWLENAVPRLRAAGHPVDDMSIEEMEEVIGRMKEAGARNRGEQVVAAPAVERSSAAAGAAV